MTGDGLLELGVGQRLAGVLIRGELAIGAQLRATKLHMRVVGVKRAFALPKPKLLPLPHWSPGQPSRSFLTPINCSPM
jgi:hypothetical protein